MDKAKVLVVDDVVTNVQMIGSILKVLDIDILYAQDGEEVIKLLEKTEIDLILLDIMMPKLDGLKTTQIIKRNSKTQDIPIIFITVKKDIEYITKGFEAGGVDYISKPFYDLELIARVKTHLKIASMTKKLQEQTNQLRYLANTDALTAVANRLKFNTIINHQTDVSNRYNNPLSLIFFDLDHFKKVNDEHGHEVGDKVLVEVAEIVKNSIRHSDVLARWGGEEFMIISTQSNAKQASILAEKIRTRIENNKFETINHLTCSFGVTQLLEKEGAHTLIQRADKALYLAKASGRNVVKTIE